MAKTVRVNIEADASGAIRATGQTVKGLDEVGKSAKKAASQTVKANKDKQKSSQKTAQSMSKLGSSMQALGIPGGALIARATQMRASFGALTKSSKALRISLIALPFVAIATAVVALFQAFRSTQEGADALNRVLEPLRAVMSRLWGMVQNLSLSLVSAFKDPVQAVKDFSQTLQDFVMRRVSELLEGIGGLGRAISHLFKGEFKSAFNEAGEAAKNLLSATNPVVGIFRDSADAISNMNAELREAAAIGQRIAEIDKEIGELKIAQTVPMAEMRREYENLRTAAGDTLLTEEERLKAADDALQLLQDIEAEEKKVLDLEIERLKLKQSLNDTSREEELELQQLIARYDELTANTERQARRIQRQRSSIVKGIQDQIQAEEEATVAFITGLEERADKYRTILKSEEELRQEAFDNEVALINDLVDHEVLSRQEADEIIAEMRRRAFEVEEEEQQAHADSILAIEQNLREQERLFLEAATEAERQAIAERIHEYQRLRDEKRSALQQMQKDEEDTQAAIRASLNRTLGEALAAGIARANSMKEFGREAINVIAREAGAAASRAVFASVPWPSSLFLAPIAGALAERAVRSFANFNTGGMVGDRFGMRGNFGRGDNRLIAANDNEMILNPAQQQAIGMANLARAGVPGASSRVSLDTSEFNEAVQNMPKNITVTIDLDDTINKIEDRQRINADREVIVT